MKLLNRSIAVTALSCGMVLGTTVPLMAATGYQDQGYGQGYGRGYNHEGLRHLIARTQQDIQMAAESEHGDHDQRERSKNAQKHLSDLDRHLTKGHFDKDELDHVIGDVQGILDHNTLMANSRNALLQDVTQLREARANYDSRH
ncbi:MAG TPA: hypothetical protein VLI55_08150 [Bryobacteraceae bacterium]|jgi:hypothetical protein|nr:hypothetical protein [Bryobacteraceae bacterium]